jgi:hypothetical protein
MRRTFFTGLVAIALLIAGVAAQDAPLRRGDVFPRWREGYLDIHQIVTGRGNAAFSIFPDAARTNPNRYVLCSFHSRG